MKGDPLHLCTSVLEGGLILREAGLSGESLAMDKTRVDKEALKSPPEHGGQDEPGEMRRPWTNLGQTRRPRTSPGWIRRR